MEFTAPHFEQVTCRWVNRDVTEKSSPQFEHFIEFTPEELLALVLWTEASRFDARDDDGLLAWMAIIFSRMTVSGRHRSTLETTQLAIHSRRRSAT